MVMKKVWLKFLLIVVFSPFFWWNFGINLGHTIRELEKFPMETKVNITNFFSGKYNDYNNDFRYNVVLVGGSPLEAKIMYSKINVLLSKFTQVLFSFNPKFFFTIPAELGASPPDLPSFSIFLLPLVLWLIFIRGENYRRLIWLLLLAWMLSFVIGVNYMVFYTPFFAQVVWKVAKNSGGLAVSLVVAHGIGMLLIFLSR